GLSDIMLGKSIFQFNSIDIAKEFLDKYLLNSYSEIYKGNKIINVVKEDTFKEIFVNLSNVTEYYSDTACYEFSESLEELKSRIDKRITNTTTSVVFKN